MDLIVNGTALRSSLGVRRLVSQVMQYLDWPGAVQITRTGRAAGIDRINELLQRGRRDAIFWSPTHRGPLNAHHHVVSVHDCINIEYTYHDDWRLPYFRRLFSYVLNRAEAVVALSRATRVSIIRHYAVDASKIVVIPAGFDPLSSLDHMCEAAVSPEDPFVLMITNALPHKNTVEACRAFAASRAVTVGVTLRVVGSMPVDAITACYKAGIKLDLRDHVDDAALMRWYRYCEFLFSPSLEEGYNLPIAEALAAGANVLCSDIPVHREFFDGQVKFFDPRNRDSMIAELNAVIDGSWPPKEQPIPRRRFRDMAADYRTLFQSIASGDGVPTFF